MKATVETIREIVKVLTADEQQLLKDTIKHGYWGDASAGFVDEKLGDIILANAEIYTTNDAKKGGHFSGRRVSAMFRSIYKKMCSAHGNRAGIHLSHCNNWWGNGSGNVLMLRSDEGSAWREWAKEPVHPAAEEKPLGEVPVGSQVYSNYSQRTYQVVEHHRNHTSVLYLDGPYKDSFRQFDAAYPVVVKKMGDGKGPTKEELVARIRGISKDKNDTPSGFSVRFVEDGDGVEMTVKRSANTNGFAATYTRGQLREIANAINAYLAK